MSLDTEIRAAERAGDEARARNLRRRRGDAKFFVGDVVAILKATAFAPSKCVGTVRGINYLPLADMAPIFNVAGEHSGGFFACWYTVDELRVLE